LEIYRELQDTINIASLQSNIGINNKEKGNYATALEYLHQAAKTLETKENSSQLASCYNTMASVYSRERSYNRSIQYHKKALNIRTALNLVKTKASSLNNLGTVYLELNNLDSAQWYFNASLEIKRTLTNKVHLVSTLNNMGLVFLKKNRLPDAKIYLEEALQLHSEIIDYGGRTITFNYLGKLYINQSQFKKALVFLDSANRIALKVGLLDEYRKNLETSIIAYEKLGDTNKALITAQHLLVIKDSLLNRDKIQALIEMQMKYETEKKEQSITLLEEEKSLQAVQIKFDRLWIISLIISAVLIFIIALILFNRWKYENRNKRKIETLMQELHHRVKNNLQLLSSIFSLQSRYLKDKNALDAAKSGENRVNAMAIIHQALYADIGVRTVNIKKYINNLIEELATSYGQSIDEKAINVDVEDFEIDVDQIIPVGLIVNELVSNVFKYVFSTVNDAKLSVSISHQGNDFHMEIKDNGSGFDTTQKAKKSMGLNIVETLCRQLEAEVTWTTSGMVKFNMQMTLK
jgi:two-component sensor histidine kinase/Tfp pilus assembly protein PilF